MDKVGIGCIVAVVVIPIALLAGFWAVGYLVDVGNSEPEHFGEAFNNVVLAASCGGIIGLTVLWLGIDKALSALEDQNSSPEQSVSHSPEVDTPSDSTLRQQPQVVKCPFCGSTSFRVVRETGQRRCSDCRTALPKYIRGNE